MSDNQQLRDALSRVVRVMLDNGLVEKFHEIEAVRKRD